MGLSNYQAGRHEKVKKMERIQSKSPCSDDLNDIGVAINGSGFHQGERDSNSK
jgi:hypothetical protein